jgi:phosphoglycerol transferase
MLRALMAESGTGRIDARDGVVAHPGPSLLANLRELLARQRARSALYYVLLGASVIVLWSTYYERWPGTASFEIPVSYLNGGDVLVMLTIVKGFSAFPAPWNLHVDRLNAPFGADWNDYPHTEKLIFYVWGALQHVVSLGTAANVLVMIASLGSALGFAWAARSLGRSAATAFVGALLFAFSHFIIGRALGHVNIGIVWHVPLLLWLTFVLATAEKLPSKRARIGAYCLVVATSLQNPYYPIMAAQLLGLAALQSALRRRREVARFGLTLVLLGLGSFVAGQSNVYFRSWSAGPNRMFAGRSLEAMRMWALRLPDLFMPISHPIGLWEHFAHSHYFNAGNPVSENSFAFLGLVGCGLLVGLVLVALKQGLTGRFSEVPAEAWVIGYVLLFSLSGGLDYLVGSLGVTWLRAVNRYSIVILCLLLFWGCRLVDGMRPPWARASVIAGAGLVSLYELFGMRPSDHAQQFTEVAASIASDSKFGRTLEQQLPDHAAVFEVPIMPFPEAAPVLDMKDCEPARPYLWTRNLRFSYGTHKGRAREMWQSIVEQFDPGNMVAYLEEHGFDALLINRKGLPERAKSLETGLAALHLKPIAESDDHDMVAYRLRRKGDKLPTEFNAITLDSGFPWGFEQGGGGRWAWSDGDARLKIAKPPPGFAYKVTFRIESLGERHVKILANGATVTTLVLNAGTILPVEFTSPAAKTSVVINTDVPGQSPGNGDQRHLGFRVIDPMATLVPLMR